MSAAGNLPSKCKDTVSTNPGDLSTIGTVRHVYINANNMRTLTHNKSDVFALKPFKSFCIMTTLRWVFFVVILLLCAFPHDSTIFTDCMLTVTLGAVVIRLVVFVPFPHMSQAPVMERFRRIKQLCLAPQQWFYHPVWFLFLAYKTWSASEMY